MSKRELLFRLRRRAKRWQFGIEVGTNSGYEHYQIRYECSNGDVRIERGYWGDIRCELQQAGGWSKYELKSGDYYQSLDNSMGKFRFGELKAIQRYILALGEKTGDRQILCVIDRNGGVGKTFLARWCVLNGKGIYINGRGNGSNILASCFDKIEDNGINDRNIRMFVDLTRMQALSEDLLSTIEEIKNGHLEDPRYSNREMWIPPPTLIIFMNHEPNFDGLSKDRWQRLWIDKGECCGELLTRYSEHYGSRVTVKRTFQS